MTTCRRKAIRRLRHPGTNPVSALGRREKRSVSDERPKRILNAEETDALIAHTDDHARLLVEVMARTGMRVGEAMGLVWSDVQPAELTVTRQLNRSGRRGELKTGRSARRIDLSAQLAAKLREHRIASPCSGDHDPVFVRRDGTPYSRSVVLRVIRNAADAAGLEGVKVDDEWIMPPLTCHSHISALIAAGWDVQEVADRPGDTGGTIMTEYSHQFDAARRAQSRRDRLDIMEAPMEAPVSTGRPSVTPDARSNVAPLRRSDAG